MAIIDTGVANTASILAVLRRNGADPFLTIDPAVSYSVYVFLWMDVGVCEWMSVLQEREREKNSCGTNALFVYRVTSFSS